MSEISFYPDERLCKKLLSQASLVINNRRLRLKNRGIKEFIIGLILVVLLAIPVNGTLAWLWYSAGSAEAVSIAILLVATCLLVTRGIFDNRLVAKLENNFLRAQHALPSTISSELYEELELLVINIDYTNRSQQKLQETISRCERISDLSPQFSALLAIIAEDANTKLQIIQRGGKTKRRFRATINTNGRV